MKGTFKMKKTRDRDRYVLKLRFWTEGEESNALEGTMTTDSLRKARNEFRSKLKCVLRVEIGRELLREIVEAGYVVAAGSFFNGSTRFAISLVDTANPYRDPPMFAFTATADGWTLQRFDPPNAAS